MVQSVGRQTLGFGSGGGLGVVRSSPTGNLLEILSFFLPLPHTAHAK